MTEGNYFYEMTFSELDFPDEQEEAGEYEKCTFENCRFINGDLSNKSFIDCAFYRCDLSNAKIADTVFRNVTFKNCKLLGLQFDTCNTLMLEVGFEASQLNMASFYKLKLHHTKFDHCELKEAYFEKADLTHSTFHGCDLSRAVFLNTNLTQCDFSSAVNYSIDPETNKITKAMFSLLGLSGLLEKYDIVIK